MLVIVIVCEDEAVFDFEPVAVLEYVVGDVTVTEADFVPEIVMDVEGNEDAIVVFVIVFEADRVFEIVRDEDDEFVLLDDEDDDID